MASWAHVTVQPSGEDVPSGIGSRRTSNDSNATRAGIRNGMVAPLATDDLNKLFTEQLLGGFKKRMERRARHLSKKSTRLSLSETSESDATDPSDLFASSLVATDPLDGDKIIIWQPDEQCIYVLRLVADGKRVSQIQIVVPSDPPLNDVESISISPSGSHIALIGNRGLSVIRMPPKWGSFGLYDGGKKTVLARAWPIAERLFLTDKRLTILKAVWYPSFSNGETLLFVLTSDNYLRLYSLGPSSDSQIPVRDINLAAAYYRLTSSHLDAHKSDRVWTQYSQDAPHASNKKQSHSPNKIGDPIGHGLGLGESAVSFDVAPLIAIRQNSNKSEDKCKVVPKGSVACPVYVLYGNGEVIIVYLNENGLCKGAVGSVSSGVDDYTFSAVGPLVMAPASDDNYGMEASDLLVLSSSSSKADSIKQPLVVISTSTGSIFHCIPLENPTDTASPSLSFPIPTLFAYETMELVSSDESDKMPETESLPMRLIRDGTLPNRYLSLHSRGLHAVTVPFMDQLADDSEQTEFIEKKSTIEHLICTRPLLKSTGSPMDAAPIGATIGFSRGRPFLLCLLASGELLSKSFASSRLIEGSSKKTNKSTGLVSDVPQREISFEDAMSEVLLRSENLPLLKGQVSTQQNSIDRAAFEFLLTSIDTLRREYLNRFELAADRIDRRLVSIAAEKKIQVRDLITGLPAELEDLWLRNSSFSESLIGVLAVNEQLASSIDDFLDELTMSESTLSDAEASMRTQLERMKSKVEEVSDRLDMVRSKAAYQNRIREATAASTAGLVSTPRRNRQTDEAASPHISAGQLEMINKILNEQTQQISQLVSQVTALKNALQV